MAKTLELLLTENVENLGIVGDVVRVRTGYARNFLLPRDLATQPSEDLIKALAAKRAEAERMVAEQRQQRAETIQKLEGYQLEITRSCNDMGILYGAVTQQEIAGALNSMGFRNVRPRDVRLSGAIKRVDTYDIHVKFEQDLETYVKLKVNPDRPIQKEEREEMDFDNEGNLIQARPARKGKADAAEAAPAEADAAQTAATDPKASDRVKAGPGGGAGKRK